MRFRLDLRNPPAEEHWRPSEALCESVGMHPIGKPPPGSLLIHPLSS
jgi:hypothetical protein